MGRQPFTPAEFDAVLRVLERNCPWLWRSSGYRSSEHNLDVGGKAGSKHAMIPAMGADYGGVDHEALLQGGIAAFELGLWWVVHDVGSGNHLHVQGLKPGPIPKWWSKKYQG